MIDALDEALRQLLIRELPIRNNEIDVAFDQPKREWSARLSRPTLNLFLYDMRENIHLRSPSPGWEVTRQANGTVRQRPAAIRMNLYYMISAWAADPDDEHRLITRLLMALFRSPSLPDEFLPEILKDQPAPIAIQAAQPDALTKPTDLWGVLDNEVRPAVSFVATLALNPYQAITTPVVRARDLRVGQAKPAESQSLIVPQERWSVGGLLRSEKTLEDIRLTLVERGLDIPVQPDGTWGVGNLLQEGEYTLEISAEGHKPHHFKIKVPSDTYDLEW